MAPARTDGPLLDRRTLNRALLERQLLLRRHAMPVLDAIHHLIGLQSQAPTPPYFGLWSRLVDFDPAVLSRLLVERQVVRASLMRVTIHLVTAADCLPLRGLLRPIFDRAFPANPEHSLTLSSIDRDKLAAAGRELLVAQPLTSKALGALLAEHWPGSPPRALAYGAAHLLPLVQVPPRGVWGASGPPAWACADSWLGADWPVAAAAEPLVRRYLAAFGPAAVADLQQWCGMTGLGEVVEGMSLRTFRDEQGRRLYDLPDAPLPDPETPVPVRFVAPFDNLLLSHADRARIIAEEHRKRVFTVNGIIRATVLVDGFVAGMWKIDERRSAAILTIDPFVKLSTRERQAIEAEGAVLLRFAAPSATSYEIQLG